MVEKNTNSVHDIHERIKKGAMWPNKSTLSLTIAPNNDWYKARRKAAFSKSGKSSCSGRELYDIWASALMRLFKPLEKHCRNKTVVVEVSKIACRPHLHAIIEVMDMYAFHCELLLLRMDDNLCRGIDLDIVEDSKEVKEAMEEYVLKDSEHDPRMIITINDHE